MLADLRYAFRLLVRSPGFTISALFVLTLGIGATTTMFGATNSVLLRPLPYPDAGHLYVMRETRAVAGFERTVVSASEYLAWTRATPVITDPAIVSYPGLAVVLDKDSERLPALQVSAEFFRLFGITPVVGRPFGRDAELPGHGDVLLVSYRVWQDRFGGRSDVVGRTVRVEGRPATIVGVLPPRFSFQMRVDLVVPMTLTPQLAALDDSHSYDVFMRLAPDVTREQAGAELSRLALGAQGPTNHLTGVALVPLKDLVIGEARTPMLLMFGAVGFVLLIACANIANLLLVRGAARQREIAVRAALGAGRGRVVRQLVTESVVLSTLGGVGGALLATWLTDILAKAAANAVPRADEIHVDGWALIFAITIAVVAGILFGVVPAWHASRTDVNDTLKREGRGTAGAHRRALGVFVISEIALAMMLLVGAGLLLATFQHLRRRRSRLRGESRAGGAGLPAGLEVRHCRSAAGFLPTGRRRLARCAGCPGGRRHQCAAAVGRQLLRVPHHRRSVRSDTGDTTQRGSANGHPWLLRCDGHPPGGRTSIHRDRRRACAAGSDRQPPLRGAGTGRDEPPSASASSWPGTNPGALAYRSSESSTTCSTDRCRVSPGRWCTCRSRSLPTRPCRSSCDRRGLRPRSRGPCGRRCAASTRTCQ